jgi:hypothetical protein
MKVENYDTTKLGNQHEHLLKREIQRMFTNCECEYKIKLNTFLLIFSYVLHEQKSIFSIIL